MEQALVEFALEAGDGLGDRRLADGELLGRALESAMLGYRAQHAQFLGFEANRHSSHILIDI